MVQHPSGLYCSEISTCLGVSNSSVPVWIRDSCKAAVVKKANDLASKKKVFCQQLLLSPLKYLFVCLKKVDQEQQLTIKCNSDQSAISVRSECKRSASRLCGSGQMPIEKGMGATASTTLSAAVAALTHGESLQFSLIQSQLLSRVLVAAKNLQASTLKRDRRCLFRLKCSS